MGTRIVYCVQGDKYSTQQKQTATAAEEAAPVGEVWECDCIPHTGSYDKSNEVMRRMQKTHQNAQHTLPKTLERPKKKEPLQGFSLPLYLAIKKNERQHEFTTHMMLDATCQSYAYAYAYRILPSNTTRCHHCTLHIATHTFNPHSISQVSLPKSKRAKNNAIMGSHTHIPTHTHTHTHVHMHSAWHLQKTQTHTHTTIKTPPKKNVINTTSNKRHGQ